MCTGSLRCPTNCCQDTEQLSNQQHESHSDSQHQRVGAVTLSQQHVHAQLSDGVALRFQQHIRSLSKQRDTCTSVFPCRPVIDLLGPASPCQDPIKRSLRDQLLKPGRRLVRATSIVFPVCWSVAAAIVFRAYFLWPTTGLPPEL